MGAITTSGTVSAPSAGTGTFHGSRRRGSPRRQVRKISGASAATTRGSAQTPPRAAIVSIQGRRSGSPRMGQRSEEHTSELQSLMRISYAVFCLKKKKKIQKRHKINNTTIHQSSYTRLHYQTTQD